jgi:hypothetical protein
MRPSLRSDHYDDVPERLHIPDESYCDRGHRLVLGDQPTENLQWHYATGRPECGVCADEWLHFIQAVLSHQSNGQAVEQCPEGHDVTHTSHVLRVVKQGDKLDLEAACKECHPLKKALRAAPPIALRPSPVLIQRQPVIPQAQLKDLRVATTRQGKLGLFHGNRVAGNVTAISRRVPSRLNSNYSSRSRELGRATASPPNLSIDRILQNTANGRCHHCGEPFRHGERVSFDHFIPLRGGGWHGDDNLRLIHLDHNSARQDRMPTEQEARDHGMGHLAPIIRILNPLGKKFKASAVPLSDDSHTSFGDVTGQRSGKWTHYQIPGFNQHVHDELQRDQVGKPIGRHAAIDQWLDAVLRNEQGRQTKNIPGWDRKDLSHQVFVKYQAGVPYLHPALKDHLLGMLPEEQRPHLKLLRGMAVWLRRGSARALPARGDAGLMGVGVGCG